MNANPELDALVDTYNIDTISEHYKRLEFVAKLSQHCALDKLAVLELGSASGRLTQSLLQSCASVTAIDGSARFLDIARRQVGVHPRVRFIHSTFEDLALGERFGLIVMHHILEHVNAPVDILRKLKPLLDSQGALAISVPNAHALSRQLAVKMGLLTSAFELTENDRRHGHKRVYDWQSLEAEVESAGYQVWARHGLALKLFADFQNEQMIANGIIGDAQLHGLWRLAEDYRTVAGAIMVIAGANPNRQA